MFSAFFWCAGEAIYSFRWNKAYLSFPHWSKASCGVGEMRFNWAIWRFFLLDLCIWEVRNVIYMWKMFRCSRGCRTNPPAAGPRSDPRASPTLCPHAGTATPTLSPGGSAGKAEGRHLSRQTQGWHEASSSRGRRQLAGIHFAAELCELAGGCGNRTGHGTARGLPGGEGPAPSSPQNSFVPAASPSRPFRSKQPCCPGFVFTRFVSFPLQLSSSK